MTFEDDFWRTLDRVAQGGPWPEPIAYMVLDHSVSPGVHIAGRDGRGRRYMVCSPSVMDAVKYKGFDITSVDTLAPIVGVQVFRREDLPDGWPDS